MFSLLDRQFYGNGSECLDSEIASPGSVWSGDTRFRLDQRNYQDVVEEMTRWLAILLAEDQVVELRALKVSQFARTVTKVGYFDPAHRMEMAQHAAQLTESAEGVYFTLNPLNPGLLARCNNRVIVAETGGTAADPAVLCRRWLLVDADPMRPSGISSSDPEKAKAFECIQQLRDHLRDVGWPEPIFADSGNGYHLLYRIDLPVKDDDLVKRVLTALAERFDTPNVMIDQSVFNASRIPKLYGTLSRKGDSIESRPHRRSEILEIPAQLEVVSEEALLEVGGCASKNPAHVNRYLPRVPEGRPAYRFDRAQIAQRARSYLSKVPPGISGQGGHNQTFRAACILAQGFDLDVEEALPILQDWNQTCQPPWSEKELRHKLEDASKAEGPRGDLLGASRSAFSSQGAPAQNDGSATSGIEEEVDKEDDDPNRLADIYLRQQGQDQDDAGLRYWRGDWYRWEAGRYKEVGNDEIRSELWRAIESEFRRLSKQQFTSIEGQAGRPARQFRVPRSRKVSNDLVNNVRSALMSRVILPEDLDQPAWVDGGGQYPAAEILAARNGLLHVPSYLEGSATLLPPTSRLFNGMALDYDIDLAAPAPQNWLAFLKDLWPDDPDSIATLQEWFGYCLLPDTSLQKMLFLYGPKRSGKGTIARVLTSVIGEGNVAGPTLSSLATNFGLSPLLGKALATVSDARLSGRSDQAVIVERLLAISGEDSLTIDRKNREPVTVKLPTRMMLISNELPRMNDASGALVSRIVILKLTRSWYEQEDPRLLGRLTRERSGILLWALEGLRRLLERGKFIQPASGQSLLDQLEELGSPIKAFVNQCCNMDPGRTIPKRSLFHSWKTWCEDRGYSSGNEATFGRNLLAGFPDLDGNSRSGTGFRERVYKGIEVRPDALLTSHG